MKFFISFTTALAMTASAAFAQSASDIVVSDRVMVQRCVLEGPSARMIAVGHPGGFNYAVDALHCAPVYAWFGGFIDFKGEISGRGGNPCKILGVRRPLGTDEVPLRIGNADEMPGSVKFRGYRRDSQSGDPTFLYEVDGVAVEQRLSCTGPEEVLIELVFPEGGKEERFYRIDPGQHSEVALGEGLEWRSPGVVAIPAGKAEATIALTLNPAKEKFVRKTPELSGAEIFGLYCSACHSLDGSKLIGPSFAGLWGREQTVTRDGKTETITVDADYIRESILKPQAAIVKGYELVPMADFSPVLSARQIEGMVEYLKERE